MLWWIGNIILLFVVVPVLVALLNRVLAALERIRGAADDILAGGGALAGELDGVPEALTSSWDEPREREEPLMPAAAVVTLIIATLIIAAAAIGLLRVILHLRAVAGTLDGVIAGVGVVADRTALVPDGLASVNASLKPVRDFCESI